MKKWNVGIYCRLSSDDGDKSESNSIGNQKSLIKRFVSDNSDLKIIEYYIDDGYSGTTFDRPDFLNMIKDIQSNKINCIIVKDLSRLGRNYIEVGNYLEKIFPQNNVRFIAIIDNIDSYKDPKSVNNVIVPFKNLMNDEYARDISNKVRSVLDNKKINGQFIGSYAPYGYIRNPKDKYKFIIDKEAEKVIKKMFNMILSGKSKKEVIDELNNLKVPTPRVDKVKNKKQKYELNDSTIEWNAKKVDYILKNRCYTGDLVQGVRKRISYKVKKDMRVQNEDWIIVPNHHKAIISKEDFNKVQELLYERHIRVNKNNEYDVLAGHLRCKECGAGFTKKSANNKEYYYCNTYFRRKQCTSHSYKKDELENDVIEIINSFRNVIKELDTKINDILNHKELNYDLEIINARIENIIENINKFAMLRNEIKNDLKDGLISEDEYWEYSKEYSNEINKLKIDKKELENKKENCYTENNMEWLKKIKEMPIIENLNKIVVDELIEDVVIDSKKNLNIIFKCEDKYFEAIDFINKQKCDIMEKDFYVKNLIE